jgi:hypothetical protein
LATTRPYRRPCKQPPAAAHPLPITIVVSQIVTRTLAPGASRYAGSATVSGYRSCPCESERIDGPTCWGQQLQSNLDRRVDPATSLSNDGYEPASRSGVGRGR